MSLYMFLRLLKNRVDELDTYLNQDNPYCANYFSGVKDGLGEASLLISKVLASDEVSTSPHWRKDLGQL